MTDTLVNPEPKSQERYEKHKIALSIAAAVATLSTALALGTVGSAYAILRDWYSTGPEAVFPIYSTVLATSLVLATVIAIAGTIIAVFLRIPSASSARSYLGEIEGISWAAIGFAIAIPAFGLFGGISGVFFLRLAALAALAAIAARWIVSSRVEADSFKADLFDFYLRWTQEVLAPGQVRPAQSYTRFLSDRLDKRALALCYLLPVALAFSGIVLTSLVATFGWGALKTAVGLVVRINQEWIAPVEFTKAVDSLPIAKEVYVLVPIGIALILAKRYFPGLVVGTRPTLIRLACDALRWLLLIALLSLGIWGALGGRLHLAALSEHGAYIVLPALAVMATLAAFAIYRAESVVNRKVAATNSIRTRRFWVDSNFIFGHYPQPKTPKGIAFVYTLADTYSIASLLLVLCRLRQLGWYVVVMDDCPLKHAPTGEQGIDRFAGLIRDSKRSLNFDWNIDWKNRRVEAAGMNFYQPIWEGLSRHFGRYALDIETNGEARSIFDLLVQTADETLLNCFRINNTVAGKGLPVRIIGSSAQFVPTAVINIFCRHVGHQRDVHFCWIQQGYQTYYADKEKLSKRISLQNMTRRWPYSNPYLPHTDDFQAWLGKGQNAGAALEKAEGWINTSRATERSKMRPSAQLAYDRIVAHRAEGKPVVCILGKMVFDLSTPFERGPAHTGMDDWINHTVEIAASTPDVLYIVKPHPYESRPEIAGRVEQYFTDLIEKTVPDNVVLLAHDWFNLFTLFPLIDLGVMWNGTSGLELGIKGIPVLMCSDWGPIDYPIGFPAPSNRDEYARMLKSPKSVSTPERYSELCALLLMYTCTDEVMIPYEYCARPLTNEPFGPPYWYMERVKKFLKDGDPHIDYACSRIY